MSVNKLTIKSSPLSVPRIESVDLCRGLSVMLMVLVHTHDMYGHENTHSLDSWFGVILAGMSLGAPVFLFAMGLSFTLSRRKTLGDALWRGFSFIALGYVVNFIWFVIPLAADLLPESFILINEWALPLDAVMIFKIVSIGDILQLSGLTMILMAFARLWVFSALGLFVVAMLIVLMSGFIHGYRVGIPLIDWVCDLFWGANWNVYFPVVPWAATAFLGMAIGVFIAKDCQGNARAAFKLMRPLGLALSLVGGILCYLDPDLHARDFFHMGPGLALLLMGLCTLLFWFFDEFRVYFISTQLGRLMIYSSPRVTLIYVIHLIVLIWSMKLFGFREHSIPVVLVLAVCVFLVSLFLEACLQRLMTWLKAKFRLGRQSTAEPLALVSNK